MTDLDGTAARDFVTADAILRTYAEATKSGNQLTVQLDLNVVQNIDVNVYFDRVFGTFALKLRPPTLPISDILVQSGNLVFAR